MSELKAPTLQAAAERKARQLLDIGDTWKVEDCRFFEVHSGNGWLITFRKEIDSAHNLRSKTIFFLLKLEEVEVTEADLLKTITPAIQEFIEGGYRIGQAIKSPECYSDFTAALSALGYMVPSGRASYSLTEKGRNFWKQIRKGYGYE